MLDSLGRMEKLGALETYDGSVTLPCEHERTMPRLMACLGPEERAIGSAIDGIDGMLFQDLERPGMVKGEEGGALGAPAY